jgi:hypothetical protein
MKELSKHTSKISALVATGYLVFLAPPEARADYFATGPIYAEDCYDLGVKICSKMTVTEVRRDGQRYEIGRVYPSVSYYSNGKCSIDTKSRGAGIISFGLNMATQPDFWGYDKSGKYVKIDADRIFFSCFKQ